MDMINFGIDLGTTNSAIAKFEEGKVFIFRNPIGQRDTLPSVVALRKERLLVGEKARELLLKAPNQVAGSFKRKMGTTEIYQLGETEKTPIELSALVIQELKRFIHSGEVPAGAVITIPASFDTVQSNATKEAGYAAGFQQVVLLQEPIAASLAYANQDEAKEFGEGKWIVYDLGGGTFDVALVRIFDGEMKVMDHEGDNFLGGADIDQAIVTDLLIPELEKMGQFDNLRQEMKNAGGRYNALFLKLMYLAENAKIQLSAMEETEIEFETEDDTGREIEALIVLRRPDLEKILKPLVDRTIDMIEDMLERNKLSASDLQFALMVGGSTYIPYVRNQIAEALDIAVNTRVDPTTAVAVGAAYFAGTKRLESDSADNMADADVQVRVRMAYQKATQEKEEYFTAQFEGDLSGLSYRIIRQDGGYDSGVLPLKERIELQLPLVAEGFNVFSLEVLDAQQNPISTDASDITITQGRYSVTGQPLPNDICLEVDDVENQTTALELIFEKNAILPLKRTLVKQMTRTIAKGSTDHLTISIVEGPSTALPAANHAIGFIRIGGEMLERDLMRGSDVEITLEMTESRDLKITSYLLMTDQEFEDVFVPSARRVNVARLGEELHLLAEEIRSEMKEAEGQANYEAAQKMVDLEFEILDLVDKVGKLGEDDVSDDKFQIEDQKRKIAQKIDAITRDKHVVRTKNDYFETKRFMEFVLDNYDPPSPDQEEYADLLQQEKPVLATNSTLKIKELIERVQRLNWRIRWKSHKFLKEFYTALIYGRYGAFANRPKAEEIMQRAETALGEKNDEKLRVCINQLCELLPTAPRPDANFGGTGIG